jgi:TonB family protein
MLRPDPISPISARIYELRLCVFLVYGSLAVLSQMVRVLAGEPTIMPGQPYPASALHWPRSPHYDTPPKLISGKAPLYPVSHARAGSSGFADVAFTVGPDGKTYDMHVIRASYPYFGSHTIVAVRDWRFEPALKNGKPVPVKARVVMPFNGWRWPISKKWLTNHSHEGEQDFR